MVEYEELRLRLLESEKTVKNLKEALAIDTLKQEIGELEEESSRADFWDDMENSQKVMQKIGSLKAKVASYENVKNAENRFSEVYLFVRFPEKVFAENVFSRERI